MSEADHRSRSTQYIYEQGVRVAVVCYGTSDGRFEIPTIWWSNRWRGLAFVPVPGRQSKTRGLCINNIVFSSLDT